jgi:hypothetical protein
MNRKTECAGADERARRAGGLAACECAALGAMAAALAMALAGCAPAVATIAPTALGATAVAGANIEQHARDRGAGGPAAEQVGKCDELVRSTPGVEQIRKTKTGEIESRSWRLVNNAGVVEWSFVRAAGAPADGWQPKPGISKLHFTPPIVDTLDRGESAYIVYAPELPMSVAESAQDANLNSAFDNAKGHGSFEWRSRRYEFTLVDRLPCYPILK